MLPDPSRFAQREGKNKRHAVHWWNAVIAGRMRRCNMHSDMILVVDVVIPMGHAINEDLSKHAIWSVMALCSATASTKVCWSGPKEV